MKKIYFLAFSGLLCACASEPTYDAKKEFGTWEATAQVKDLVNNKTYQVGLDIIGAWPQALRIDVSGTMAISLATIVMKKNEIRYAVYRQAKYYQGTLSDRSLLPLFHINLNPKYLLNVCFDKPISEKGWSCVQDKSGMISSCERVSDKLLITWTERAQERKRATITGAGFEVQIVFKTYSTKVRSDQDPYRFDPPGAFTKYKIL